MSSPVTRKKAAKSSEALEHFDDLMRFETDCWDVHFSIQNHRMDFVLLDVRSEDMYSQGHIAQAMNLPHQKINEKALTTFPIDSLFVVYCAEPHCNAIEKAAIRLAKLNRPVKKMIGGVMGWLDEGFSLTKSS